MKTAIYAGSFDPITNGHLDVILRSTKLFENIIIAIADDSEKTVFNIEERVNLVKEATKDLNVEVESFKGLLLDFVKRKDSNIIIRGLRAISDFEFEFQRTLMNRKLDDSIESIFIMTKDEYSFLSSSLIKEAAGLNADISKFVPKHVEIALKEKMKK